MKELDEQLKYLANLANRLNECTPSRLSAVAKDENTLFISHRQQNSCDNPQHHPYPIDA